MSDPHKERLLEAIEKADISSIHVKRTCGQTQDIQIVFGEGLWVSIPSGEVRRLLLEREANRH